MKKNIILWIFSLTMLSALLTGCTGQVAATSWPGVTYSDGTVYIAYGQHVYAVKAETGTFVWRYPEKADAAVNYYAAPALTSDGQLIIADYKGKVTSLNAVTGQMGWSYTTTDRIIADILVEDQAIYVSSSDYSIYALNLQGSLIWKYETGSHLWSKPFIHEGVVYQTSMDHMLYALSSATGTVLGTTELGAASISQPIMDANNVLYATTMNKEVLAISPETHQVLWRYTAADYVWSGVSEKDGILYFGDLGGNVVALDTATQKVVWQYKAGASIVSAPLLLDDKIVFTSEDGMLNAVDYAGKAVFAPSTIGKQIYSPAIAAGDKILVGVGNDSEKILTAVNGSGITVWSFQPAK